MDAVGPRREQLTHLLRSLSPWERASLAGAALALCIGFGWLVAGRSEPGYVPALGGRMLSPEEADAAQRGLSAAGLGDFRADGGALLVPEQDRARYDAVLAGIETPPGNWGEAWERANASLGHFSAGRERDEVKEIARAKLVGRLLARLPDIEHADVVWDEDERVGWRRPPRVRATVYLKPRPGRDITLEAVQAVRLAVAGSKSNLQPSDVAVMDLARMVTYDGTAFDAGFDRAYQRAVQLSSLYRRRVEDALAHIDGVRVAVLVEPRPARSQVPDAQGPHAAAALPDRHADGNVQPALAVQRGGPNARLQLVGGEAPPVTALASAMGARADAGEAASDADHRVSVSVTIPMTHYEQVLQSRGSTGAGSALQDAERSTALAAVERDVLRDVRNMVVRIVPEAAAADGVSVASAGGLPITDESLEAHDSDLASFDLTNDPRLAAAAAILIALFWAFGWLARRVTRRAHRTRDSAASGSKPGVESLEVTHEAPSPDVLRAGQEGDFVARPAGSVATRPESQLDTADAGLSFAPLAATRETNPDARPFPEALPVELLRDDRRSPDASGFLSRRRSGEIGAPGAAGRRWTRRSGEFAVPAHGEAMGVDALVMLDSETLRRLHAELADEDWAVALTGASPAVKRRLVEVLAVPEAAALQKALRHKRPVRLRDLEAAHGRITRALARLQQGVEV